MNFFDGSLTVADEFYPGSIMSNQEKIYKLRFKMFRK